MIKNMNMNQLRIFLAVAGHLSFTRASEELNLTQPGISKHIKELEEYYGARLFDRLGKKVALTQAGEILLTSVKKVFGLLTESKARIDDLKGLAGGKLAIGASFAVGTYILPGLLAKFRVDHPAVEIMADIALSRHVVDKVLDNALEIGFIGHLTEDKRLTVNKFRTDRLVLIVSVKHPWANRKSPVHLRELSHQPFLLSKKGSGTRETVEKLMISAGVTLDRIIEIGNTEGVKKAVEADLGISILSHYVVSRETEAGLIKAVPLAGRALTRNLYVVYHKDRYLSEAARAFMRLV